LKGLTTMHGSLHLIYATEADRNRREAGERARLASSLRRPFGTAVSRLGRRAAAAHGIPPRAAPGGAATLRGR
jgi:hypothetical protein